MQSTHANYGYDNQGKAYLQAAATAHSNDTITQRYEVITAPELQPQRQQPHQG